MKDGVVKTKFWFTSEEQNKILDKANSINFFSLHDKFKYVSEDSIFIAVNPNPGEQILRIKSPEKDKTIKWTYPLNGDDTRVNSLLEMKNFIISVIESKPEYQKLPPAKGGYL